MSGALSRRGLFIALAPLKSAPGAPAPGAPLVAVLDSTTTCLEAKAVGCRRCAEVCDVDAISFAPTGGGRARLAISEQCCTGCGACRDICPVAALNLESRDRRALAAGLARLVRDPSGASA